MLKARLDPRIEEELESLKSSLEAQTDPWNNNDRRRDGEVALEAVKKLIDIFTRDYDARAEDE